MTRDSATAGENTIADRELLRRHLAGDAEAVDRLIRRHIDMVYATARRQVGDARAEDVTQAVFLLMIRKAGSLASRENAAGWLYRAAGYCAANVRKTEARRQQHEREAAMRDVAPPVAPDRGELLELLDKALGQLSEADREAVLLRHLEGKSFTQAGQQLGISEEAARKRADRGVERLRMFFGRRGYTTTAATVAGAMAAQAATSAPAAVVSTTLALAHGAAVPAAMAALTKAVTTWLWWTPAKVTTTAAAGLTLMLGTAAMPVYWSVRQPTAPPPPPVVVLPGAVASGPATTKPREPLPPEVIDVTGLADFADVTYTRVTVDFDDAKPADAARILGQALSTQVNLDTSELAAAGVTLPPLSMHQHDVPWLQAVFQFARITQSYPTEIAAGRVSYLGGVLSAANAQPQVGLWKVAGPFAVEFARLEKARTELATPGNETMLTLNVFAEPNLRILQYPTTVTLERFVDDKGQDITLGRPRGLKPTLVVPVTLPEAPGRRIGLMTGSLPFVLPAKGIYVETTFPGDSVKQQVGDLDVELLPMTQTTNPGAQLPIFHMQVRYRRGRMDPAAWNELIASFSLTPPTVYDGQNHTITANYLSRSLAREDEDTVSLTFNAAGAGRGTNTRGDPHHYRLEVPLGVKKVAVPFEFSRIALP